MTALRKIVAAVLVVVFATTAAAAAVADPVPAPVAGPIDPTTPYPAVPANPDVCKIEKLEVEKARLRYEQARREYERLLRLYEQGFVSGAALRAAEIAMHQAAIALNTATYAEAACRNTKGSDPHKACVALALELNRLIDELALRRELERLARAAYDAQLALYEQGMGSLQELERARLAWELAQLERQQAEQRIADQRAAIAANPACRTYPSDRPTPPPTTDPTPPTPEPPAPDPTATPAAPIDVP